jgi:hypothetical protein
VFDIEDKCCAHGMSYRYFIHGSSAVGLALLIRKF